MQQRGIITLTQGNINNNHLYLTEILSMFQASAIGGPNDTERAPLLLEIHCGIGNPVATDIAGDKKIFRKRAWVREFFDAHKLKAGDRVVVEKTGSSRFYVYPCRAL